MKQSYASRTILSVWPEELAAHRYHTTLQDSGRHEGGSRWYRIEGCPKGEFRTLQVFDAFQITRDYEREEDVQRIIDCNVIADDLVREWASNRLGGSQGHMPGVIMCEGASPTAEEVKLALDRQTAYFQWLCDEATSMWSAGDKGGVGDLHRKAGKWLGLNLQWVNSYDSRPELKECPWCFTMIDGRSKVCRQCLREVKSGELPDRAAVSKG